MKPLKVMPNSISSVPTLPPAKKFDQTIKFSPDRDDCQLDFVVPEQGRPDRVDSNKTNPPGLSHARFPPRMERPDPSLPGLDPRRTVQRRPHRRQAQLSTNPRAHRQADPLRKSG